MFESMYSLFRVGDTVFVDTYEGFGGPAVVVEVRDNPSSRCKVRMLDGTQPPFWAHDFELTPREEEKTPYDSRTATLCHIQEVRKLLATVTAALKNRAKTHDLTKLESPEKEVFDEYTPKLKASTYGSDEYREFLKGMKVGLDHHYANNRHHPEHFAEGIRGMNLIDVIEMLCDWKAATLRHADGDLRKSIEINQKRFGYSDELKTLLVNTAVYLGLVGP